METSGTGQPVSGKGRPSTDHPFPHQYKLEVYWYILRTPPLYRAFQLRIDKHQETKSHWLIFQHWSGSQARECMQNKNDATLFK